MILLTLADAHDGVTWKCTHAVKLVDVSIKSVPCKTSEKFIRNSLALAACRENAQRVKRKRRREEEDKEAKGDESIAE